VFTEAGRSAGAVYRYFPKKEAMILGVVEQNIDYLSGVLRAELEADAGDRTVGEVVARLLEAVMQDRREGIAKVALAAWSEAGRDPALAERLRQAMESMRADMTTLVRTQQEHGQWPGVSPEAVAQAILLVLPGFMIQVALRGDDSVVTIPDAMCALWPDWSA
jgi:AcrR family transcriptional regulator